MDIGRAFSYVFDDDQWLTVILLGGLLLIVPIFGQIALLGFMVIAARNIMQGNPKPLPNWSNIGDKFMQGLYVLGIQLVYSLPILVPAFLLICVAGGLGAAAGDAEAGAALASGLIFCLLPLLMIFGIVLQVFALAAMVRFLHTGSFGAAMQFGSVISEVRSDIGGWAILWALQLLCGFVAGAGSFAFGVGALFTTVYAQAVFGHLLGQMAQKKPLTGATSDYPSPTSY
jgi:hypothetical protein